MEGNIPTYIIIYNFHTTVLKMHYRKVGILHQEEIQKKENNVSKI